MLQLRSLLAKRFAVGHLGYTPLTADILRRAITAALREQVVYGKIQVEYDNMVSRIIYAMLHTCCDLMWCNIT